MPGRPFTSGPARFPRALRLKRRALIRSLFDRSRSDVLSVAVGCIRLLGRTVPRTEMAQDVPFQVGFSPGRRWRGSVERNRVRRILREVFRRHQSLLSEPVARRSDLLIVMVLFRGEPALAATQVPRDLPEALRRLASRVSASEEGSGHMKVT